MNEANNMAPVDASHHDPKTGHLYKMIGYSVMIWDDATHKWCKSTVYQSLADLTEIVYANVGSARATTPTPRIAAHEFLERGVSHMRDRAVQRDSEAGERSMARAVAAFNAQEGTNLTEAQGWRFMIQLKYARAVNGVFVADDYEDLAAYAGLAGEAAQ
jgi:hypothetical protein